MTQGLTGQQLAALLANLNPNRVAQRDKPGTRGKKMSYLEAWDVKSKLIAVFGFANFDAEVLDPQIVKIEEWEEEQWNWANGQKTTPKTNAAGEVETKTKFRITFMATYRIVIHATGATYSEVAIASQTGTDPGEVADFAVKTAESDALKRCATWLGTQFGLSLYASDDNHVHYNDVVGRVFDPDQMAALEEFKASRPQSPSPAAESPEGSPVPGSTPDATEAAAGAALAAGFDHPDGRKK